MTKKLVFHILIVLIFHISSFAQKEEYVVLSYNETELIKILKDLESNFNVIFSYQSTLIQHKKISLKKEKRTLSDFLFEISELANIDFNIIDKKYIYITKREVQELKEVIVKSYLTKGIQKKQDASFNISLKKMGLLSGLTEADVLESIQQLPGVISNNETASQFNVRGGRVDQNNVIWDDIPIYHPGHLFGMVSVFNPNIADNVSFYNKGTNVRFGDKVSSVVDIKTNNKVSNLSTLEIGLNGISADAVVHFPIIKNKMDIQFSFRRSYEDIIELPTFIKFEEKAFQNTHIDDEFFYFKDYNVKLNYQFNKNNFFAFSLIHIDNDLITDYHIDNEITLNDDKLDIENDGYSVIWKHQWNSNLKQKTSVSLSDYRSDFSSIKKDTAFISNFIKNNYVKDVTIYSEIKKKIKHSNLIFGYQYNTKMVDFLIKEKKDITYILDYDNSTLKRHAMYASYLFKYKDFHFNVGFRTIYFEFLKKLKLEPRFVLTKKINKHLKLQLTGEIKNQTIKQINQTVLSDLTLDNKIWRLVDGKDHPIINAKQITLGGTYKINKWIVDLDFYHKNITGMSSLSLGFLNPIDNQIHIGNQKGTGLDFFLKKRFNSFNAWVSYSFMDVKNKYENLNDNKYFYANTNISHNLTATINYNYKKIKLALSWRIRSGKPLTDLDYDSNNNAYFDGINTEKHPTYHRLDLSALYRFNIGKTSKGKVGLSVKNIYNNRNYITTSFEGNQVINDPIRTKKYYAIGLTPNFVFRMYF